MKSKSWEKPQLIKQEDRWVVVVLGAGNLRKLRDASKSDLCLLTELL